MACTRQGNKERGTARDGPTTLVRQIRRRANSRAHECTCTGSARKNRAPTWWWCARAKRRRHCCGDGTTPTTCARQRVCAHTTPGQRKARPWLDGGVLSVRVPTANRSSVTHVEQRNDTTARQRSARGDDDSGTCKRPARLDGRLSSDGGSARRRGAGQRATCKQRAHKARSSLGSKAGSTTRSRGLRLTLRSWTRRRRRRGGAEEEDRGLGLLQGKQSSTMPSLEGPAPIPRWRLDHGRLRLGRRHPWFGLLRLRSGHARADDDEDARLRPPPRMALPQRLQLLPSSSPSPPLIFGGGGGFGGNPQGGGAVQGKTGWGGYL
jgi:hypothetical protein